MIFVASSETAGGVGGIVAAARLCVERIIIPQISAGPLGELDLKVRYTPIVMPEADRIRYPERSKARISQKIYDCAPQLDFAIFSNGTWELQLEEYVRGLRLCLPHLHRIGANKEQVEAFRLILATAPAEIVKIAPSPYAVRYDNGSSVMEVHAAHVIHSDNDLLKKLGFQT